MKTALQEAFDPAPVPGWLEAFDADRTEAVEALVWGRFYFGSLQMAEPTDLLIDWLDLLGNQGEFASQLDGASLETSADRPQ